jgi:enoyl-CoA hydratase
MAAEITLERVAGVATITLDAPDRRNALTRTMARELVEACETADSDPEVGAVVVRGAGGAGMNLAFATDVRVVGREAKLVSGFLPIGLHPGGGHGVLLGRTGAREAAAALTLFGERVDGARAAELGLAWEAVDDDEVEDRAQELAAVPGADPELARRTARSLRAELGPPAIPWPVALELERAAQMWSMRRKDIAGAP